MDNSPSVLNEYAEIFSRFGDEEIIDLEDKLKNKSPYQIFDLKEAMPQLNYRIPPIRDNRFHIFLIKKGTGEKTIGLHKFPIKNNTLAVIPRKMVYSGTFDPACVEGYLLFFSQEFLVNSAFPTKHLSERYVLRAAFDSSIILSDYQVNEMSRIFEFILSEQKSGNRNKKEMIGLKILELLIFCDRFFIDAENSGKAVRTNDLYERLNLYIDRNFDKSRKVNFYAKLLCIHPNHLNFVIKKSYNTSVKHLIDKRIIIESKYLLLHTDYSVKEISYKLGFDDQNYFSFFFKKHTGLTTQEFRLNVSNSNKAV